MSQQNRSTSGRRKNPDAPGEPSSSTLDAFADRRQQRMRGAGKHEISSRTNIFFDDLNSTPSTIVSKDGGEARRSSIAALLSSSVSKANNTTRSVVPETPLLYGARRGDVSSSPAMSIRSGRGPASSPSKYIDPRLLGDDVYLHRVDDGKYRYDHSSSPVVNGRMLVGKTIEERRRERMRGAGVHQIESRPVRFSIGDSTRDGSSSDVGATPRANGRNQNGTPWKSPAGSLDYFMQSLAERGKTSGEHDDVDDSLGRGDKSDWIEQRRAERRRGAGTHAIEQRKLSFAPRGTGGSTTASSIAGQDEGEQAEKDWIDQRRAERRRGAGTHAIEQRKISFGPRVTDESITTSTVDDREEDIERVEADWIEQRRAERRRGAGMHEIEQRKISFGPRATDGSITASSIASPHESFGRYEDQEQPGPIDYNNDEFPNDSVSIDRDGNGFDLADNRQDDALNQPPGSTAAMRAGEKRKRKRQGSPARKKATSKSRKATPHRMIDIDAINEEGDETVMAQADLTLQEQREAAFVAPAPPQWTFPKAPITNEDLANMKEQVQEMVTLALGNEAAASRNVKVNDADVLYSIIKKEISRARQSQSSQVIKKFLDGLLDSVLDTFTYLSRQSAERSQLIAHLVTARRRNLQLRKEVFKKRSHVLNVTRTMHALKEQEIRRVQREEDEEKSLSFLKRLQEHAHEWN